VLLRRPNAWAAAAGAALAAFLVVGLIGARAYVDNFLVYRGFAPPREATFVKEPGTLQKLAVSSPALGGRQQETYVYLPPGYSSSGSRRYPVVYLLHGFPGRPLAFITTVQMGVLEDSLIARHRAQPLILVMPFGSTGTFTDKEWVDGATAGNGWGTFVTRDLVRYVDSHYRTVATRAGRGIGGLSEGGYGAINLALQHPGEFSVVESWSGYVKPDPLRSIFGTKLQLLARNDPTVRLARVAPDLRKLGTYFWIYSGTEDHFRRQDRAFTQQLTRLHIGNRFFESFGGHNWALWRKNAAAAYIAAAGKLRA
jgi:S-formylglutathione hydrolase FrmB